MLKKSRLFMVSALVIASICGTLLLFGAISKENAIKEKASQIFYAMQIQDAQFKGSAVHEILHQDVLNYESQDSGYTYSFDPETGRLVYVQAAELQHPENDNSLTAEQRDKLVLAQVLQWIQQDLIGELRITKESDSNLFISYRMEEYYGAYPTGTQVWLSCTYQGRINLCGISYGAVLTKNASGEIVPADPRPLIAEEEAITIGEAAAMEAMEESSFSQTMLPEKTTCTLRATGDRLFYYVEVYSHIPELYEGYYQVLIDPYDGTVQEVARNN